VVCPERREEKDRLIERMRIALLEPMKAES
jgi:hypothetical protein